MQPTPMFVFIVSGLLFATGLGGLVARTNLIKMVIGIEFLGKGVCLLFILGGYLYSDTGTSQAVVFTLIAIEAVIAGVALALVIVLRRTGKSFDNVILSRSLERRIP